MEVAAVARAYPFVVLYTLYLLYLARMSNYSHSSTIEDRWVARNLEPSSHSPAP